jgi:POT family proton-dependent oligopeptide transporter
MDRIPTLEEIQNFEGKYLSNYGICVEMWERFLLLWNAGYCHFMADKVLGLALSDRDANLKYGAIQAFVYAFTFIGGIFADKVLGFKNHSFWC